MNKIWWIVLAAVVVGGLWLWSKKNGNIVPNYQVGNPAYSPVSRSKSGTTGGSNKSSGSNPAVTATPATNPAFSQLEMQYQNLGQLIQFDALCHSTPAKMVVKSGAKVMLDNRSTIAKTIRLDNDSYDLPAWTYRFVTAKTTRALPYDLGVDCLSKVGNTQNETDINIQALISKGL